MAAAKSTETFSLKAAAFGHSTRREQQTDRLQRSSLLQEAARLCNSPILLSVKDSFSGCQTVSRIEALDGTLQLRLRLAAATAIKRTHHFAMFARFLFNFLVERKSIDTTFNIVEARMRRVTARRRPVRAAACQALKPGSTLILALHRVSLPECHFTLRVT